MKLIIALICGIAVYIAFNWFVDYLIKTVEDRQLCAPYPVTYTNDVLYCECNDKINQEPGKCEDKYK